MKNLDLKVKITVCDPTARNSKLILEDAFNVDRKSVCDVWASVCNNADLHSAIFLLPRNSIMSEFKFEVLIGDEVLDLTLGKPVEAPMQLLMYDEVLDLFTKIKLKLCE